MKRRDDAGGRASTTSAPTYPALRSALADLIREAVEPLEGQRPTRAWKKIASRSQTLAVWIPDARFDPTPAIHQSARGVSQSAALGRLCAVVRSHPELERVLLVDAAGKIIPTEGMARQWLWSVLVSRFLEAYFRPLEEIGFVQTRLDDVYLQFEGELVSGTDQCVAVRPMLGIDLLEPIQVKPGVVLRRISNGELEEWLNGNHPFGSPLDEQALLSVHALAECSYARPLSGDRRVAALATAELDRITLAIQLLGIAEGIPLFTEFRSTGVWGGGQMTFAPRTASRIPRTPHQVTITAKDAETLAVLADRLGSCRNVKALELPLRRWSDALLRERPEDKLIDQWIALESLLLGDSTQELVYRMRLRLAAFIGEGPEERRRLFVEIGESYACRSRIVHGSDPKKLSATSLAAATHEWLRRCILKIATLDRAFDPSSIEAELLGARFSGALDEPSAT